MAKAYTFRYVASEVPQNTSLDTPPVQDGIRLVLRDVMCTTLGTAGTVSIFLHTGGTYMPLANLTVDNADSTHLEFRQALHVGESLRLISSDTAFAISITAYQLVE